MNTSYFIQLRRWLLIVVTAICLVTSTTSMSTFVDSMTSSASEIPALVGPKDDHCG